MCRLGMIKGDFENKEELEQIIIDMHKNGATRDAEIYGNGNGTIVFSRFPITSDSVQTGGFPLKGERYIFAQNGEVYEYKGKRPIGQSDSEFALEVIEKDGLESFLDKADLQGTIIIYDKKEKKHKVIVDQLNSAGFFYATSNGNFFGASEYAVVNQLLKKQGIDVPINIIKNGTILEIDENGTVVDKDFRPQYKNVWSNKKFEKNRNLIKSLEETVYGTTKVRIPKEGPVAVLCSGGIDSSFVLTQVVRILKENNELDRLKVYTYGSLDLDYEQSDLKNVLSLFTKLDIDKKYLKIISPDEIKEWKDYLRTNYVFSDNVRLITPNPNLNSQTRHSVMMSCVLAYIVKDAPETKVVLTADAADELFAGYNSMRYGAETSDEFKQNIHKKLNDLPLNDLARITLASYFGCSEILKYIKNKGENVQVHPIEVRTPFTSHKVLDKVLDIHVDYAVNETSKGVLPKYLLRIAAIEAGVPEDIALRKKIPFNEGATGQPNGDNAPDEVKAAANYISMQDLYDFANKNISGLIRFNIINEKDIVNGQIKNYVVDISNQNNKYSQIAVYHAACSVGLKKMLLGNIFREKMPDTDHSTSIDQKMYLPKHEIRSK